MKKVLSRLNVVSVLMFVFSFLLIAYSIWAAVNTKDYIKEGVANQQIVIEGNEFNIFSFYMTNCIIYVIYALILFGIGYLSRKPKAIELDVQDEEVHSDIITKVSITKKEVEEVEE